MAVDECVVGVLTEGRVISDSWDGIGNANWISVMNISEVFLSPVEGVNHC